MQTTETVQHRQYINQNLLLRIEACLQALRRPLTLPLCLWNSSAVFTSCQKGNLLLGHAERVAQRTHTAAVAGHVSSRYTDQRCRPAMDSFDCCIERQLPGSQGVRLRLDSQLGILHKRQVLCRDKCSGCCESPCGSRLAPRI